MTVRDELFRCSSENKGRIDNLGIIEIIGITEIRQPIKIIFRENAQKLVMGVSKVDIDVMQP